LTMRGGNIQAESEESAGGRIDVSAGSMIRLIDSGITTRVAGGTSDAGNINLQGGSFILDGSKVDANAMGESGQAGNIQIAGRLALISPESLVQATNSAGISGRVDIRNPISNLCGTLTVPPVEFLSAVRLLRARCSERYARTKLSSFIVSPVRAITPPPEGWRPMPFDNLRRQTASTTSQHVTWPRPFDLWHVPQTPCGN